MEEVAPLRAVLRRRGEGDKHSTPEDYARRGADEDVLREHKDLRILVGVLNGPLDEFYKYLGVLD